MGVTASLLDELIEDAKLVAAYCQRTGRLRDVSLPAAIASVEKLGTRSWNDGAVVKLQAALNDAMQAIAPISLVELKGWPHPFVPQQDKTWRKFVFGVLSATLMFLAAWYTLQYNIGLSTIRELERLQTDKVEVQFGQIVRKLMTADPKIATIIANGELTEETEIYLALLDQLQDIDDSISDETLAAGEFLHLSDNPIVFVNRYLAPVAYSFAKSMIAPDAVAAPLPPSAAEEKKLQPYDPCGLGESEKYLSTLDDTSFVRLIKKFRAYVANMLCAAQVTAIPFVDLKIDDLTVQAGQRINVLALWFIPAIYGALGATIYYMRRILDPTLPDPPFRRIVYRVALGAFSGVILAWFWTPTNRLSNELADISLNLFGAAFLLGFSVEIFFTFLDRMVYLVNNWIRKIGTTAS